MSTRKTRLYIDAQPIVDERMSGVGWSTLETIQALTADKDIQANYEPILVVPWWKRKNLDRWDIVAKRSYFFVPGRIINLLTKKKLLPPIDLCIGRGIYLFFNFRNWPLISSKSITYIHDISYKFYPEFVEPKNRVTLENNVPRWMNRSTFVVTVSESSANEIRTEFPEFADKVRVVKNGVDLQKYKRQSSSKVQEVQNKYGLPKKYLLFLSSLEPRKNLQRGVKALMDLPENLKQEYPLVIVGGMSWLSEGIESQIEHAKSQGVEVIRPNAYVTGDDLPAVISGAVALFQPSLHEGFGMTPLEAAGCGVPVLASDIAAHKEVLGDAACYFDPLDVKDISVKIERMLRDKDLRGNLRKKAALRAKDFSWTASLEQLKSVIHEARK